MSRKSKTFVPFGPSGFTAIGQVNLIFVVVAIVFTTLLAKADVVAPNGNESVDGVSTSFPFNNTNNRFPLFVNGGVRYQQIFDATDFSNLVPGGELITGIRLRPDSDSSAFGPTTISNTSFELSTTGALVDGLSSTFASNVGANSQIVRSGNLSISSSFMPGPGNTRDFDIIIDFTNPFFYDPANGNLLLDITNSDPTNNDIGVFFDSVFDGGDSVSRLVSSEGDPTASFGVPDTDGLVVQFVTSLVAIPEPSSVILLAAMAGGLMTRRRRKVLG